MIESQSVFLLPIIVIIYSENIYVNHAAELISTYSKVARWGANNSSHTPNEARSSGQTLWAQRSDVDIKDGQTSRQKQPVTYYYSMRSPTSKLENIQVDDIPAKGEVEERFNPYPYFDFTFRDPPRQNRPKTKEKQPSETKSRPPTIVFGTPTDSVPTLSKPPTDTYSSPFSSYNPPNVQPSDSIDILPDMLDFPPNNNQPPLTVLTTNKKPDKNKSSSPPATSYGAPPTTALGTPMESVPPLSNPPTDSYSSPFSSYNPPSRQPSGSKDQLPDVLDFPPNNNQPPLTIITTNKKPPATSYGVPNKNPVSTETDNKNKQNTKFHPPLINTPSQKPDNSYYTPPAEAPNESDDQPPENFADYGPPMMQTVKPPTNGHEHNHPPSMAEDDLSPPPADVQYGKIPQYLDHDPHGHQFYHFNHDVYHEVHTTPAPVATTTEAPRAGAGHYSYYYLGRKLWYIPLYFSVYFIVYVTVLILKSIARHKIQFSHNFDKTRSSRQLAADVLNQTVITAIDESRNKYM